MNRHQITNALKMADLVGGQGPLVRVREAGGRASETVLCRDAQRTRGQTDGTAVKEGRHAETVS